jgi:uncharacterized tellurite resistance protein B-like protein
MGLLAKLFNDSSDTEFRLAQDLVAIAIADGVITPEEQKMLVEICQKEGISQEELQGCLMGNGDSSKPTVPRYRRDKNDYIVQLIKVMGADGYSSPMEIYLLEIIASKMGLSRLELVSLVLTTATRRNFPGDVGVRTLTSFMSNVIDPKSKTIGENRCTLSELFDIIAKNIPQGPDQKTDTEAFVQAISRATEMLHENTILDNEFRAMGIDFETVLADERERAIRRWLV